MGTLIFFLALTGAPQGATCKPQLAPLQTGTSSGTSTIDFWRKEEAGDWGGTGWLGWSWDGDQLRAVELDVRHRPNDFAGDEEYVTVQSQPDVTFAVRCLPQLRRGPILSARIANWSLQSDGPLSVTLGRREYQVYIESARADQADARIVLTEGGRRQVLYSADGFTDEPHYDVVWAGDVDRDGQLDLVVNLHRKYSWHPYRLLLSSVASKEQLVGDAALFETGD